MSLASLILKLLSLASICVIFQYIWSYLSSPIKNIPGPFAAKFTNLWRLFDTWGGRTELTHQLLHQKYGQIVRIGPDIVSLSDPALICKVYDSRGTFLKVRCFIGGEMIFANTMEDSTIRGERHKSREQSHKKCIQHEKQC
jgi:hypothetical protein